MPWPQFTPTPAAVDPPCSFTVTDSALSSARASDAHNSAAAITPAFIFILRIGPPFLRRNLHGPFHSSSFGQRPPTSPKATRAPSSCSWIAIWTSAVLPLPAKAFGDRSRTWLAVARLLRRRAPPSAQTPETVPSCGRRSRYARWPSAVGGSSHRRERRSLLVGWVAFGDPLHQERVRDREHHRADEEPDYPEGDEPTDHAREDQQQRQVGTPPDQDGPQEVVERAAEDRPHEKAGTPHGAIPRVDPHRRGDQHRPGSDLCNREHEHQCGQDRHEWHAGDREPDPGEDGLENGRDDDSKRHGPDRPHGEMHGVLTPRPGETPGKTVHAVRYHLGLRIQDRDDDDREQELDEQQTETAHVADEPEYDTASEGRQARGHLFWTRGRELPPARREPRADHREGGYPPGGLREGERLERLRPVGDLSCVLHDRRDAEVERHQQDQQQRDRHDRNGDRTPAPEPRLHAQQYRPGRDRDHRRPGRRHQKRAHYPKAAQDQSAEGQQL